MQEDFAEHVAKVAYCFASTITELLERKGVISAPETVAALRGTASEMESLSQELAESIRRIADAWERGDRRVLH